MSVAYQTFTSKRHAKRRTLPPKERIEQLDARVRELDARLSVPLEVQAAPNKFHPDLIEAVGELVQPVLDRLHVIRRPVVVQPRPIRVHPVEVMAYRAHDALLAGRTDEVDSFLRNWLRINVIDNDTYGGFYEAMSREFQMSLSQHSDPARWLFKAVIRERKGIIAKREGLDPYTALRLKDERTAAEAAEEAAHRPGMVFTLPPAKRVPRSPEERYEYTHPKCNGMFPPSSDDPLVMIAEPYALRRRESVQYADILQAIEDVSNTPDFRANRERAAAVLEYANLLREAWRNEVDPEDFDRKHLLKKVKGENALRSLKHAVGQKIKKS